MALRELLKKNPFCYIDCSNEDECRIRTGWKWFLHICKVHFSFATLQGLLSLSQPQAYHVFSFTTIRALFVIMQMRKHAGNLIRAQIWFHMKNCLRGWGCCHGIILSNQIMLNVCFHNRPRTHSSFRGLRCILVGGLKLQRCKVWLSFVVPRDAEWKLQLMEGIMFPISSKTTQPVCMHFCYCCSPSTKYPSA